MKNSKCFLLNSLLIAFFFLINSFLFSQKPLTIPELKEWKDGSGQFIFNKNTKIVVDINYKTQLSEIAITLQEDIKHFKGYNLQIEFANGTTPGNIFLSLNSIDDSLGLEGYALSISDGFEINSKSDEGVFWGTRTFLQLLKQSDSIKSGSARDFPDFRERGLMIDLGRQFFSADWLKNHIRELSYCKMNLFHLHLSDNEGFRLESKKFPLLTSKDYYTNADIKSILALAAKYYIKIVPEIDMPNHTASIVSKYPYLGVYKPDNSFLGNCCMDITKNETRQFINDLLEEYLDLFTVPEWHLGTDEYDLLFNELPQFDEFAKNKYGKDANAKDACIDFINWVDSIVNSKGKTLRIWNDFLIKANENEKQVATINKNIIIEHWKGNTTPQSLFSQGYKLINCNWERLYLRTGGGSEYTNFCLFHKWNPNVYFNENTINYGESNHLGSKFNIWCDYDAETETQVAHDIFNTLRILGQKNWGHKNIDTNYEKFLVNCKTLGLAPGTFFSDTLIPNDLAYKKKVFSSSNESKELIPENAVDGDYTTRWSSQYKDLEWIYVDLEKVTRFTRVKLKWEWAYATNYQIQVSNDALYWKTIQDVVGGDGEIDDFPNLLDSGRFVRINCLKRIAFNGNSLWEFEIFDSLSIKNPVSVNNFVSNISKFKCFPNPFVNELNIEFNNSENDYIYNVPCIEIFDYLGNKVYETIIEMTNSSIISQNIKLPFILSGLYIVKLSLNNEIYTSSIFKE